MIGLAQVGAISAADTGVAPRIAVAGALLGLALNRRSGPRGQRHPSLVGSPRGDRADDLVQATADGLTRRQLGIGSVT
jgi:hypothetical protein